MTRSMDVRFRSATPTDAPAILRLWAEADAHPSSTDDIESLQRLIAHDPAAVILAEHGEAIVGSVIAGWDGWRGWIYRLAVSPSHRRRGLGRELVRLAEEHLSQVGARRTGALVLRDDDQAMAFWEGSGWSAQPEILRFVRDDGSDGHSC